jgi:hypothetical protein
MREINYHDRNDDNDEFGAIILETLLLLNMYLYFIAIHLLKCVAPV